VSYARVFFYTDSACQRPLRGPLASREYGGEVGPPVGRHDGHRTRHWLKVKHRPSEDGAAPGGSSDTRRHVTVGDFPGKRRVFVVVCYPGWSAGTTAYRPADPGGIRFWLVPDATPYGTPAPTDTPDQEA
jgi:hypothetical protein